MTDGGLTAAYDRIEVAASALRRSARSQAQAAREEQATRRLQALLPAPGAAGLGADGAAGSAPVVAPAAAGSAPAPDGIIWGSAGSAGTATGGGPGVTAPSQAGPAGLASPEMTARLVADGAPSAVTRVEECPHCRQPVTVIIVAAATPAAGGPVG